MALPPTPGDVTLSFIVSRFALFSLIGAYP